MTIYNLIKDALIKVKSSATIHVLNEGRTESESLNWNGVHIIIHPEFSSNVEFTHGAELINTTQYRIKFLTIDEWDSPDYSENSEEHSLNLIKQMTDLMNTVFWHIIMRPDVYLPNNAAKKWSSKPVYRENNSTMSGINATFNLPLIDNLICSYE